ncbi:MAG: efflux RND transporter periplasmic adaptor subunit [Rhodospirillaceae bacterium]|jgi:RND family efflux transporter MFP subunit|nr:efflux RND transporter periplasmic adaptor subunit [Rhodospirillaceae bacterium]MBT6137309.1 efflux RND transporter periplasmic adaptor subunit [Rhodospirillaceae bacterium]
MKLRAQMSIIVILAAGLAGGWLYWNDRQGEANSKEPNRKGTVAATVLVEPTTPADDKIVLRAIGTGEARRSANLHADAAGEVVKVAFKAGQRVKKGAVLLRLDDRHQRLAVRLAEVAIKEAERQLKRLEQLAVKGAASLARLETAQTALESAILRRDQMRAALRDRTVFAPFEGVIGLTDVNVGDRIDEDTPIATLDDRNYIDVGFNLPEEHAPRLAVGMLVDVFPRTMPEVQVEGRVSALGSRIDRLTRSLRVEAEIANPEDALRPGSSFEVQVSFVGQSYPSVREVAVLWSRDGAYVWRVKGDRAEKVFVKIVRRDGGRILVSGPLHDGDMIVVEGVQGLRAGQRVKAKRFGGDKLGNADLPAGRSWS